MVQQIQLNSFNFFRKPVAPPTFNTGRPALEVDDTIIVDNLPAHHGEAKRALREFLEEMSIELCLSAGLFPRPESSGGGIFKTEIQISTHCSLES